MYLKYHNLKTKKSTPVFKFKMPVFGSQEGVNPRFKANVTLGGGLSLKLGEYFAIETEHAEYIYDGFCVGKVLVSLDSSLLTCTKTNT